MENFYFQIRNGEVWVSVADENNKLIWPDRSSDNKDWYGHEKDCPYPMMDALKKQRRRLEDYIRKNNFLLIECLELATKKRFPI